MKRHILFCIVFFYLSQTSWPQDFSYLPKSKNKCIIAHTSYTLSFINRFKVPEWVAYKLTRNMLKGASERTIGFIEDPLIPRGSASPKDYIGSGYDKGHLCPAGDMSSSPQLMKESFYMSNMSPQEPSFNRGIWSKLEKIVRNWADRDSLIYIVTGPILGRNMAFIGKNNRIAVPEEFYKVVLYYKPGYKTRAIGFILQNHGSREELVQFAVTVDSVESRTGIDFFPGLPDEIEKEAESQINITDWGFEAVMTKKD